MSGTGLAVIALLYGVTKLLRQLGNSAGKPGPVRPPTGKAARTAKAAPQTLDQLLAEMLRGESRPARTVPPALPAPADNAPPASAPVSLDNESFEVAARRRRQADERERGWTPDDHAAFDRRIRAGQSEQPAAASGAAAPRASLRQAVLWQQILGPPKGLE